ncbi:MAG: hypothetical protein WC196_03095 [Bacilli bacterium]|nr:hypothetical protein [Bacilli bacterium]
MGTYGGSVTFSKILASSGDIITATYTPDNGYVLASASIKDDDNNTVTLTGTGATKTFTMPSSHVTYYAVFKNVFDLQVTLTGSSLDSVTTTQHCADDQVLITASPKSNYGFEGIYLDSVRILEGISVDPTDGSVEYTLTMPAKDSEIEVVFTDFAGGSGTQSDPYRLYAANQIKDLSTRVSPDNTNATTRNAFRTAYYQQEQDIDGAGTTSMYPIGTSTVFSTHYSFAGKYDGKGYSVDGITISKYGNTNSNLGLFGYTESARIMNLSIGSNMVIGDGSADQVGGIVGYAYNYTELLDVTNNADINGGSMVGGIVGKVSETVSLMNVANNGNITGVEKVGGIVGNMIESIIYNAYNTGAITATKNTSSYAGGITGYLNGSSLYVVYNVGTITAPQYDDPIAGRNTFLNSQTVYYALSSSGAESNGYNPAKGSSVTAIEYMNAGVTWMKTDYPNIADSMKYWGGTASAPVYVD